MVDYSDWQTCMDKALFDAMSILREGRWIDTPSARAALVHVCKDIERLAEQMEYYLPK